MRLDDLFPEMPQLILNGIKQEVKFTTRSLLQLERDYPDQTIDSKEITSQERIIAALNSGFTMMKTTDLVNLLYAGLINNGTFNKETLIDAMQLCDFPIYIDHIITAYQLSKSTPEQLEKMEVMAAANKSKKKMDQEIMQASTPTIGSSAD